MSLETKFQHDGLPEADLRDLIGRGMQKCYDAGAGGDEDSLRRQIKDLEAKLQATKELSGYRALLELKGWTEFDVSDHVNYDPKTFFPFIGTETEKDAKFSQAEE